MGGVLAIYSHIYYHSHIGRFSIASPPVCMFLDNKRKQKKTLEEHMKLHMDSYPNTESNQRPCAVQGKFNNISSMKSKLLIYINTWFTHTVHCTISYFILYFRPEILHGAAQMSYASQQNLCEVNMTIKTFVIVLFVIIYVNFALYCNIHESVQTKAQGCSWVLNLELLCLYLFFFFGLLMLLWF